MANGSDWTRGNFKKTSNDVTFGVRNTGSLFHGGSKVPGFADGTKGGLSADDWAAGENYGDGTTAEERLEMTRLPSPSRIEDESDRGSMTAAQQANSDATNKKKQSFGEAFKEARARGEKTFTWEGKPGTTFSTDLASDKKSSKPTEDSKPAGKSFSEDVADRKANAVVRSMTRDENYGNEGRRPVEKKSSGRGVIDTSNVDSKTLLPRR